MKDLNGPATVIGDIKIFDIDRKSGDLPIYFYLHASVASYVDESAIFSNPTLLAEGRFFSFYE